MSGLDLQNLRNKSREIIKAEIGALLFNLGKTHIGFWEKRKRGEQGEVIQYFCIDEDLFRNTYGYKKFSSYKDYFEEDKDTSENNFKIDLNRVDNGLEKFFYETTVDLGLADNGANLKLSDIVYGGESKKELVKRIMFRGCENINSGIDKGAPREEQQLAHLSISNPFGTFKEKMKEDMLDRQRLCFLQRLWNKLKGMPDNPDALTHKEWVEIRNFIINEIKSWYCHLLSDSRFPINDVTLWDQAYMTASMFKSALAAVCLDRNNYDLYKKKPHSIKWNVLGIQYDKLGLAEKALKPYFIKWYRDAVERVDNQIKQVIEEEYALGNEIYRDETGIYFLFPENASAPGSNSELLELHSSLQAVKDSILMIFKDNFEGEIFPSIYLTKPSRGTMNLAYLLDKAKENFTRPCFPESFKGCSYFADTEGQTGSSLRNKTYVGLCQICGMRLAQKDTENLILCEECSKKKKSRFREWLNSINGETVWTGDLQDENGRIALVTLKFELKEWLNGNLVNTTLTNETEWKDDLDHMIKLLKIMREICLPQDIKSYRGFYQRAENEIKKFLSFFDKDGIRKPFFKIINKKITQVNNFNNLKKEEEKPIFNRYFYDYVQEVFGNISGIDAAEKKITERDLGKNEFGSSHDEKISTVKGIFAFSYIQEQMKNVLLERSIGDRWENLIEDKLGGNVNFEERKILWNQLSDEQIEFFAEILLQFIVRKNPSPARFRRIWETTEMFFIQLRKRLKDMMGVPQWRVKRIIWDNVVADADKAKRNKEYNYQGLDFWVDDRGNAYLISSIEKALSILARRELKEKLNTKDEDKIKEIHEKIINKNTDWLEKEIEAKEAEVRHKRDSDKISIKLNSEKARYEEYQPYFSIIEPTPVSWQFIIPAQFLDKLIENVQKEYKREFKYVMGKLPLHIGIIIQDYKKPLYVGIKALRKIRRDIKSLDGIEEITDAKTLKMLKEEGLYYAGIYEESEELEDLYSLYPRSENTGKYEFYIDPLKSKAYLDTVHDSSSNTSYRFYPNTIDFEFLDVNTRRNDINYNEKGKRFLKEKSNRPYTWEEWYIFEDFIKYFDDNLKVSKLHGIITLMYSKLKDWKDDREALKTFMLSAFVNMFELNDPNTESRNEMRDSFSKLMGKSCWKDVENLTSEEFVKSLQRFIDMFEFWHKGIKRI